MIENKEKHEQGSNPEKLECKIKRGLDAEDEAMWDDPVVTDESRRKS